MRFIDRYPGLRQSLAGIATRIGLRHFLYKLYWRFMVSSDARAQEHQLPLNAQIIYSSIKKKIDIDSVGGI